MPAQTDVDVKIVWTRRGDPDPAIDVGEEFDVGDSYRCTYIKVGGTTIKMYKDRAKARRTLVNLLRELTEQVGAPPGVPAEPERGRRPLRSNVK